jgi:hypothetical protein
MTPNSFLDINHYLCISSGIMSLLYRYNIDKIICLLIRGMRFYKTAFSIHKLRIDIFSFHYDSYLRNFKIINVACLKFFIFEDCL